MRKIEEDMINAIERKSDFREGNTKVEIIDGVAHVYLHENEIARVGEKLEVSWAGRASATTRSRLNAVLFGTPHGVSIQKGMPTIDDIAVDAYHWYTLD